MKEENKDFKKNIIIGLLIAILIVGIIIAIVSINGKNKELQKKLNVMTNGIEMPEDEPNNENPSSSIQTQESGTN